MYIKLDNGMFKFLSSLPSFYLMPPKKKAGISRKVCIIGLYSRPDNEPTTHNAENSTVPTATSSRNHLHVLSFAEVAAAQVSADIKYNAQLQSKFLFYLKWSIDYGE